jgi:hypothetical protein
MRLLIEVQGEGEEVQGLLAMFQMAIYRFVANDFGQVWIIQIAENKNRQIDRRYFSGVLFAVRGA